MKKNSILIGCLAIAMTAMTSCGSMPSTTTGQSTTPATSTSQGSSILGALMSGGLTDNSAINSGSGISGIIGQLIGSVTGSNTIVGTWSYTEPTVQFESENFLAQAGGAVATKSIVNKIQPYYEKVGIKAGSFTYTFNEDKTCTYTIGGREFTGTYEYDNKNNTLVITSTLGIKVLSAYVTVSANNLAVTFDSSKLLTLAQTLGAKSNNQTISGLTSLSQSFNGMKTGFLFVRK